MKRIYDLQISIEAETVTDEDAHKIFAAIQELISTFRLVQLGKFDEIKHKTPSHEIEIMGAMRRE